MDSKIYKVEFLEKEPDHVDVKIEKIQQDEEPLVDIRDIENNFLVEGGKEVLKLLRDFALGKSDTYDEDHTYQENNPFDGPIRRTQIPSYIEDVERFRNETQPRGHSDPQSITKQIIDGVVISAIENFPDCATIRKEVEHQVSRAKGWAQETTNNVLEKLTTQKQDEEKLDENK